ncbi:MAG: hypothetical protein ACTHJT_10255 [Cytophaga sp.]|uniref:hypothetical protein n=1 Tax=Cytophaga sp. TaxID=29535 RepID=UPI003F7DB83E
MNDNWQHIRTITDGEPLELHGLNIWNHDWKSTGESIRIKDPLYGQDYTFPVYEISNAYTSVQFAAGEFSNDVWGIYMKSY